MSTATGNFHPTRVRFTKNRRNNFESCLGVSDTESCEPQTAALPEDVQEDIRVSSPWKPLVQRAVLVGRRKLTRYDIMNMDAQAVIDEMDVRGAWAELRAAPRVGEVVKVCSEFFSNEETAVALKEGSVGVIEEIDIDGDALVRFPGTTWLKNRARGIIKKQFKHLVRCFETDVQEEEILCGSCEPWSDQ